MQVTDSLVELQIEREKQAQLDGIKETVNATVTALESGRTNMVPYAQAVLGLLYQDALPLVEAAQATKERGLGGKYRGWLRALPADVLTVLALDEGLSVLSNTAVGDGSVPIQSLTVALGRRVQLETLVRNAAEVSPVYIQKAADYLKSAGTTSRSHTSRTMRQAARNVLREVEFLSTTEYAGIGKHLLDILIKVGMVVRAEQRPRGVASFILTKEVRDVLTDTPWYAARKIALHMLVPPAKWTTALDGGYLHSKTLFPLCIRGSLPLDMYRKTLDNVAGSELLDTLNYLQETPFVLDEFVANVLRETWMTGGGVLGVPRQSMPPKPEYPFADGIDLDTASEHEKEIHERWKVRAKRWHDDRIDHRKSVLELSALLRNMQDIGRTIYNPVFMDSRGRTYYRGRLNPQGSDRVKGLYHFAEGKPLGKRGLYWLKVHVANCFGYDSTRFNDRVRWVDERIDLLRSGIERPQDSEVYTSNTEAPMQAIAAARALIQALDSPNPERYVCNVPVHMDATCSGLQILSALLRDPVGAYFTNLVDNAAGSKSDIYAKVGQDAMGIIERDTGPIADFWKTVGVPRDLAKRPVMTYVYGVTLRGVERYALEYILENNLETPDGIPVYQVTGYLAKVLMQAVASAVPLAAQFMEWLKDAIRGLERVQWTVPSGLLVQQYYEGSVRRRVHLRSCGVTAVVYRAETGKVDSRKMADGIVPNFVHSLDASLFHEVAKRMRLDGLSILGVHDSFATHPCDVDVMHRHIRESFVDIFGNDNILKNFIEENGLNVELPEQGTFDVREFINSEFGFS